MEQLLSENILAQGLPDLLLTFTPLEQISSIGQTNILSQITSVVTGIRCQAIPLS